MEVNSFIVSNTGAKFVSRRLKSAKLSPKIPRLSTLLKYKNPNLILRFSKDYGVSIPTANMVFKDMLRFLWIIAGEQKTPHPHFKIGIYDSMTIIDEMWHTFFLFSQEYQEFCFKYFGKILFHSGHPNPLTYAPDAIPNRERMIEFIWKEFGSGTARRWFDTYQKKYSKLKIKKMQLSAALKQ